MNKQKEFIEGSAIIFKNVKLRYPHLKDPDTKFRHQWSTDIIFESEAEAEAYKSLGFAIKDSEDGPFLKVKKYCQTAAGKTLYAPNIVSRDPSVKVTEGIGTGTTANVKCWCKYQEVQGTTHLCAYLDAVQVLDLVEYKNNNGFDDEAGGSTEDVPF